MRKTKRGHPKDSYMDFKDKKSYNKWNAYGHIHGLSAKTPGNQKIRIGGKVHKVKHLGL